MCGKDRVPVARSSALHLLSKGGGKRYIVTAHAVNKTMVFNLHETPYRINEHAIRDRTTKSIIE